MDLRRISVFDSTLRDGEQAPGNTMSPEQKLAIARGLEAVGVTTVEAGFPASSPSDFESVRLISKALTSAKFATLNRATRSDIEAAAEAGGVDNHQLQVMATGSNIHLEHKRGITRRDAVREIADSFRFAASLGFSDVSLGIEDASRGSDDLLRSLIESALSEGGATVVLADTTGCMHPAEFGGMVARVKDWTGGSARVSVHCHDDFGLSLANALAGIAAGAGEVQATLAGIGERAGNTALEELAAVLAYKGEQLGVSCEIKTQGLYAVYELLCAAIGPVAARNKAIFGENAFSTEAGIHQAGLLRNPITYEFVEPSLFGRERRIMVGRHSGRNIVRHVLEQFGFAAEAGDPLLEEIYRTYIAEQVRGECIELDELRTVIEKRLVEAAR
ncbi:LeuA family protein [Amycolatopsis sp. NPDC054798]